MPRSTYTFPTATDATGEVTPWDRRHRNYGGAPRTVRNVYAYRYTRLLTGDDVPTGYVRCPLTGDVVAAHRDLPSSLPTDVDRVVTAGADGGAYAPGNVALVRTDANGSATVRTSATVRANLTALRARMLAVGPRADLVPTVAEAREEVARWLTADRDAPAPVAVTLR